MKKIMILIMVMAVSSSVFAAVRQKTAAQAKKQYSSKDASGSSSNKSDKKKKKEEEDKNFELRLSTDMEFYYFYVQSNMNAEKQDLDFSDAKSRMKYRIDPVYMISFQGYARWRFLSFDGDYKTDRCFKRGGSVSQSDQVPTDLTKNRKVSEIIQAGVGLFGLRTSYRVVQFDSGTVDVLDYSTRQKQSSGRMMLNITSLEIFYDFYPAGKDMPIKISPGYKYMDYKIPRIVYRFEDTTPGETDTWEYTSESTAQPVRTKSHMGGIFIESGMKEIRKRYGYNCGMGFFVGPNRTRFTIENSNKNQMLFSTVGSLKVSLSALIFDSDMMKGQLSILYSLDFIDTESMESNSSSNGKYSESRVKYVYGSTDYFNGLSVKFDVIF